MNVRDTLATLGLRVFERGWLSSNSVLCAVEGHPTTLVDTGYSSHADLTVALVRNALAGRDLNVIVNTHLHSDHCGGNASLMAAYRDVEIRVPANLLPVVQRWDMDALTFVRTLQRCERFAASNGLSPGDTLNLGGHAWQVHAAPGHDPDALMLFQPDQRVLMSGDALWERRLAVVFPELEALEGFESNARLLDHIEALAPALVIPGHGRPFSEVAQALAASRKRLEHYRQHPADHETHARRALLMFHMLEHQSRPESAVVDWFCRAPVLSQSEPMTQALADDCIQSLLTAGVLARAGAQLLVNDGPRAAGR